MRDIKFRAWDKKEKRMFVVYGLTWHFGIFLIEEDGISRRHGSGETELMQYTGLKDKNGKEIYEGDIVHEYCSNPNVDWTYEVFYDSDEGKFWLRNTEEVYGQWNAHDDPAYPRWDAYEVIGNIYEN